MADPFSLAASTADLLSLTIKVVGATYSYVKAVKNAQKTIVAFKDELRALRQVLPQLEDSMASGRTLTLPDFQTLTSTIQICESTLLDLLLKLDKPARNKFHAAMNQLIWPLKEKETLQAIDTLHRYTNIFEVSLSIDGIAHARLILKEVKEFHQEVSTNYEDEHLTKVLHWISKSEYQERHHDVQSRQVKQTGQWLLTLPQFSDWCSDTSADDTLWCSGIPGSGKTMITSIVIEYIRKHFSGQGRGLLYFYCDYRDQDQQIAENILSSLLRQICSILSALPPSVSQLYERAQKGGGLPKLEEVCDALEKIIDQEFTRLFIIIDALDECESVKQRKVLIDTLKALIGRRCSLKLFITSRPHLPDIAKALSTAVTITIVADENDIRRYLEYQFDQNPGFDDLLDETLKEEVCTKIIASSQGMYVTSL